MLGGFLLLAACGGTSREAPAQRAKDAIATYAFSSVSLRDSRKVGRCGVEHATTSEIAYLAGVSDPTRRDPADIIKAILTRTGARACMEARGVSWR